MKRKLRTKSSIKGIYIAAASISAVIVAAVIMAYNMTHPPAAMAAAAGDYRAKATGNWNALATWEYYDGTSWIAAAATPTSASGEITIPSPFTVTVSANVTVDQVIVDGGGTISINAGRTLTIANGAGIDLSVAGTVDINGSMVNNGSSQVTITGTMSLKNGGTHTIAGGATVTVNTGGYYDRQDASLTTSAGIWTIQSGGTYAHNVNGGNIIIANWNAGSTCLINGITTTRPGNFNQNFYNFTWNCASQTSVLNLQGKITNVLGDFTWVSTGSSYVRLGEPENYTCDIGGNYYHQGGTVVLSTKSQNCRINIAGDMIVTGGIVNGNDSTKDSGEGSPAVYITGDLNLSAGTINFSQYKSSGVTKGHLDIHLNNNWVQTGGDAIATTSGGGRGEVFFAKAGTQYFNKTGGTLVQPINFTVNSGSITDLNTSIITGEGTFDLISGGELRIGDPNGITATAASGNVQVTGTRTFINGGYYTYNGGATQVTGDGLPTVAARLTIDNASGVALTRTTSISGTLYLTSGTMTTPSDTIIVGTSGVTVGSITRTNGMVDGTMKRWFRNQTVNDVEFPLGTGGLYQGMNLSYTSAPTSSGSITAEFAAVNPGKNGFDIYDAGDTLVNIGYGLWSTTTGNGLNGGTFSLDITATALATVVDVSILHIVRRANSGSNWLASGTHAPGTGTNAIPIAHRTGLTSHGQWGIGSGAANPLPVKLLYFKAKQNGKIVNLNWATATELNNDYFTIERSPNGWEFEDLLTKRGAGTSSVTAIYSDQDILPLKGTSYYRLRQTDFNGVSTTSEIKSVQFIDATDADVNLFSVYPNPFNSGFNITFTSGKDAEATFMLLNNSGSVVAEEKIQASEGFNNYEYLLKTDLPQGIYYAYLIMGETRLSQKIIKQ